MAYRNPGSAYARRNAIRRQISDSGSVQAQESKDTAKSPPSEPTEEQIRNEKKSAPKRNIQKKTLADFFGSGGVDNDKIIIIALIVILAREGADIKLLLALGYILM